MTGLTILALLIVGLVSYLAMRKEASRLELLKENNLMLRELVNDPSR